MRSGEHLAGTFIVGADRDHQVTGAERRFAPRGQADVQTRVAVERSGDADEQPRPGPRAELAAPALALAAERSEEHTSELQSLMRTSYAVSCLKKKNKTQDNPSK